MRHQNFKICFYIRVSTEEQAENPEGSIKNQEERLLQTVKLKNMEGNFGEVVGTYIDRAKSGKDTNRTELQKMLQAIRTKKVNLVMVSELSRISRNMRDFSDIWELMKASSCGFYSLRENFDTTTAAGEMVLYTLANLAQFERRQVAERVTANMNARAQRGLWNGGHVPLGYSICDDKPGKLFINEAEAKLVRAVFEAFLFCGTLGAAAKWLNENGYNMPKSSRGGGRFARLEFFTCDNVQHILRNKVYTGLKKYNQNGEVKVAEAQWEPIIDRFTFDRVQETLTQNKSAKKLLGVEGKYPYIITGLVKCATCGDNMVGKSAHGKDRKVGYYEHSWATKRNSYLSKKIFTCDPHRVPAKILEPMIIGKVKKLLTDPMRAKELIKAANASFEDSTPKKKIDRLRAQIYGYNSQLEAMAERLSELPKSVSPKPLFQQMEKIERQKQEATDQIREIEASTSVIEQPIEFAAYAKFLNYLASVFDRTDNLETQSQIIKRLIGKIEVGSNFVRIHYLIGENLNDTFDLEKGKAVNSDGFSDDFENFDVSNSAHFPSAALPERRCSNSLTVGAPRGT